MCMGRSKFENLILFSPPNHISLTRNEESFNQNTFLLPPFDHI